LQNKNGHVLVTDFGFAFLIAGGATTMGNSIGGTAGYIAPEIIRNRSLPTPTTDIYSLGVLLWTLVTGTLPQKPFPLCSVEDELAPVSRIVKRCLSDEPPKNAIRQQPRCRRNS